MNDDRPIFVSKAMRRTDPKKVGQFHSLVDTLEKSGMNTWDARMKARELLKMRVPNSSPENYK